MAAAEQKKSYAVIKQFRGLNTKANRTAIDESEFAWIENAQPIGYGNIKIIPNSNAVVDSGANAVVFSNTVTHLTNVNIGLNDYVVSFMQNGSAQYYNIIRIPRKVPFRWIKDQHPLVVPLGSINACSAKSTSNSHIAKSVSIDVEILGRSIVHERYNIVV